MVRTAASPPIAEINGDITKIDVYVAEDGKLHFVNSKGEDTALDTQKTLTVTTRVSASPLTATATTSINGSQVNTTSCSTPGDSSTHSNSSTTTVIV